MIFLKNSRFRQLELVTVAEKRPKKSLMHGTRAMSWLKCGNVSYLVRLGGVGACLPCLLVFLLSWTTVLLLVRIP